jgi:Icc-related predicted phosphoesterase
LVIVGFPCSLGSEEFFIAPREPLPTNPEEWLLSHIKELGAAAQIFWLMHEPPRGTIQSQDDGPTAGNQEWNDAIKRFAPWLVVCGHDHHTPIQNKRWYCEVGTSTCTNVGQTDHGPLHYLVIKVKIPEQSPNMPSEISITAYPWKETIDILS